jgi:hypothetical protein
MLKSKLMEVATAGKMQILMSIVFMWMMGSSISIYLLMFLGQGLYTCFSYLMGLGKAFAPFENMPVSLAFYKLIYVAIGLGQLGVVLYKAMSVGLLPIYASDWVDLVPPHLHEWHVLA